MKKVLFALLIGFLTSSRVFAAFGTTGTTTVSVTVANEASIQIDTATTSLTTSGTIFNDFSGTTNLTYKLRTTQSTGTGSVTLQVTGDFSPSGGPSVATPPSSGDVLSYVCTVASPGTA